MERAEFITDEHLEYLDSLRDSGITNMFGAAPYVENAFDMPIKQAREVLSYWMKSYSERQAKEQ